MLELEAVKSLQQSKDAIMKILESSTDSADLPEYKKELLVHLVKIDNQLMSFLVQRKSTFEVKTYNKVNRMSKEMAEFKKTFEKFAKANRKNKEND